MSNRLFRTVVVLLVALGPIGCDCGGSQVGKATNGVTLVEPSGTPEEFERTVDFGTVRVGKLMTQTLLFRNDGRSTATITTAQLVTQSSDFYLAGVTPLPSLEPGVTWQVVLRYLPSDVGDDTADVVVETDVADTAKYTIHVRGKGARSRVDVCTVVGGAEKCFSNTPEGLVVDLGEARPGETKRHAIVIKNSGDAPAGVTHVAPTDATSSEYTTEPIAPVAPAADGSFEVAPAGQGSYDIVFTPVFGGDSEGVVEVASDDPDHPVIPVKVKASAIAPRLCVDPLSVEFGDPGIGNTATKQLKLTSCGREALSLSVVQLVDDQGVFAIATPLPSLPTDLAPGTSLALDVTYAPKQRRADEGQINLRSNGGNGRVMLRGQGDGCMLTAVPSPVSFGQVSTGTRASKTVQIRNAGSADCTISEVKPLSAPFGVERVPALPASLPAGQALSIAVYFEPASAVRATDTLHVVTTSGGSLDVTLTGSGTAPSPCTLTATPSSVLFSGISAGQTSVQNVVLKNVGTQDCDVLASNITGPDASSFRGSIGGCIPPTTIGPGASQTVPITFAPMTSGNKLATFEVTYKNNGTCLPIPGATPSGTKLTVSLEGGTLAPAICVDPVELVYGTTAETKQFTIRSCGAGALAVRGVTLAPGSSRDFSVGTIRKNGQAVTLPKFLQPNEALVVDVPFAARGTGSDFGTVMVLSNDPSTPRKPVKLKANPPACSNGINYALLTCNTDTLGFPTTEVGRPASMTVVCQNTGTTDVHFNGATLAPGTSSEFRVTARAQTVPPGGSVRLEVTYTPTNTGTDLGSINLQSDSCQPVVIALNAAGKLVAYPRCVPPQVFQPQEKWAWTGGRTETSSRNVSMSPLVLNLTDDNGDGRIDESDVPDVIFTSCKASECCINCMNLSSGSFADSDFSGKGILRAVNGRDGSELWSVTDPALVLTAMTQLAAGDLDGDNVPEIVAVKYHFQKGSGSSGMEGKYKSGALLVFDNTGRLKFETELWSGDDKAGEQAGAPTIGDLDGDGAAEILFEKTVFRNDGTKLFDLPTSGNFGHGAFVSVIDLDNDGTGEILQGRTAYTSTGARRWSTSFRNGSFAVVDADGDGKSEVVLRDDSFSYLVLDGATGSKKAGPFTWSGPVDSNGQAAAVCPSSFAMADVNGDRKPDVIIPSGDFVHVFDTLSGRELWRAAIDDYSRSCGASGAAAFDFEGDGKFEVVYHDSDHMYVFRGQDGTKLYDSPRNSSTIWETPVIADVDNDGHADLIMTNENGILGIGGGAGVKVLSNAGNTWPSTRRIWNEHAYHQTSVNENGSVPRVEIPNWTSPGTNNWRANPSLCVP